MEWRPPPSGNTHGDINCKDACQHPLGRKAQTRVLKSEWWRWMLPPPAVDKCVGPATSAVYAAYQKPAARIFSVSTQSRRAFISILKLYVTDTACIPKWRPLKHNDYETIIIWRSTRGGPRPKCSPRAVYKGHARAVTLISKRNFRSPSLSLSLSLSPHLSLRRSSLFPLATIGMRKKHRECSIACEI